MRKPGKGTQQMAEDYGDAIELVLWELRNKFQKIIKDEEIGAFL